jgi:hypothetical protein
VRSRRLVALLVCLLAFGCSTAVAAEVEPTEPASPPTAITRGVYQEKAFPGSALIFGTVETHGVPTNWRFQWGRTTSYGSHTGQGEEGPAINGDSPVPVEGLIGHLKAGKTYHYRLVVWNESGRSVGADRTFKARG